MGDAGCEATLELTREGGDEVQGDTPNTAQAFKKRYRQDEDYQRHIQRVWGERAYDSRPQVAIDTRTAYGIDNGWGYQCTGKQDHTASSRSNAEAMGVKCCSKFQNGQIAFNLPGPKNGPFSNHDCGYGWSGRRERWDDADLDLVVHHPVPQVAQNVLALAAIPLPGAHIDLVSGQDFANLSVFEQLHYLDNIAHRICRDVFGDHHPIHGYHQPDGTLGQCGTCEGRIQGYQQALGQWPPPSRALCRNIVLRIFGLFNDLHQAVRALPVHRLGAEAGARRLRKALQRFTRNFLRLCTNLPQPNAPVGARGVDAAAGQGGYKKRRSTRKKRRRRKRKTRRRRRIRRRRRRTRRR